VPCPTVLVVLGVPIVSFWCAVSVPCRSRVLRVGALWCCLGAALAACGGSGSEGSGEPAPSESRSVVSSPTPTPTSTGYGSVEEQTAELPRSAEGIRTGVLVGRAVVRTPQEQEVLEAWRRYWQVLVESLMEPSTASAGTSEVASGEAARYDSDVIKAFLAKKVHLTGTFMLNPVNITVSGNTAIVIDCALDRTVNYKSDGTHQNRLPEQDGQKGTLKKIQDTWTVVVNEENKKYCEEQGGGS